MEDLLICKCGWYGKVEDQNALGSECGCCPDCGNEDLIWLNELQDRIKELEVILREFVDAPQCMHIPNWVVLKCELALKGGD